MKGGLPMFNKPPSDRRLEESDGSDSEHEESDDDLPESNAAISQKYGGKRSLSHKSESFRSEPNKDTMKKWLRTKVPVVMLLWTLVMDVVTAVKGVFPDKTVKFLDWVSILYPRAHRPSRSRAGFMRPHPDGAHRYTHRFVGRFTLDGSSSVLRFRLPGFKEVYDVSIPDGWGLLATGQILKREFTIFSHEVPSVGTEMYTLVVDFIVE
jgi:hypothetical protein